MPRTWFEQLVVSAPQGKPRSALGVALSIGTHAVLAASLVVIPALGRAQLPETEDRTPIPTVHFAPPVAAPTPPPDVRVSPRPRGGPRQTDTTQPAVSSPPSVLPIGEVGELEPGADPAPVCLTGCGTGDPGGEMVGAVMGDPGPPEPVAPVRVSHLVREPRRVHYVEPRYPDLARAARVQDIVILECVLDEAGRVSDIQVLRGHELLRSAAVDAVRQWRYTPTLLNGVPVRVVMTVTVRFTLGGR